MVSSSSALTSSSSASSLSLQHRPRHRRPRGRNVSASVSLLFLVTILVSTCSSSYSVLGSSAVVVVASFSPSTPSTPTNSRSRGILGRTKPTFGGNKGSSSSLNSTKKKTAAATTSKTNEGIEQNSKAYTRLREKSVPREARAEEKEEETNQTVTTTTEEETNQTETLSTAVLSMPEEEGTKENEISSATTMAAASEFSEQNKEMNSAEQNKEMNSVEQNKEMKNESSDSPKEEEEQQQEHPPPQQSPYLATLSGDDPEAATTIKTKKQLQSQLLSKDAMYQNQIDALTEQASADIHALESNIKVLQHEYSNYRSNMTEQLTTAQVTASEKEGALFQEMTTLLSKLEEEQQAVQVSTQQVEQLQQEICYLQQQITEMKEEYASTLHDLEDDYELEQNARSKDQAEHVSELLRVRQEAVTHVEAVEKGANEHTDRVRVEYNKRHTQQQEQMESVQVKLTTVQQSLRDREDLIAEWAADRSSAKTMTRQVWQLLKGRVVARVRRIKSRLTLWFSDEAP